MGNLPSSKATLGPSGENVGLGNTCDADRRAVNDVDYRVTCALLVVQCKEFEFRPT